jgi:hypothetical protein
MWWGKLSTVMIAREVVLGIGIERGSIHDSGSCGSLRVVSVKTWLSGA